MEGGAPLLRPGSSSGACSHRVAHGGAAGAPGSAPSSRRPCGHAHIPVAPGSGPPVGSRHLPVAHSHLAVTAPEELARPGHGALLSAAPTRTTACRLPF